METDKKFIELMQALGKSSGLDEISSTVFALLYIEPEEIAMEDIAKQTGYSLASISNKLKLLEQAGFARRIKKPGTKKIYLYMEKDYFSVLKKQLEAVKEARIRIVKEKMPLIISEYKSAVKSEKDKKKLRIIENYYSQIMKLEIIITDFAKQLDKMRPKL
jgi:DNA-binding transcriptional regulator GbsR (MarR family)